MCGVGGGEESMGVNKVGVKWEFRKRTGYPSLNFFFFKWEGLLVRFKGTGDGAIDGQIWVRYPQSCTNRTLWKHPFSTAVDSVY